MPPKRKGDDLQAAVRAKGYDWQAASTPLSLLSLSEKKAHLGLTVTKAELQATATAVRAANAVRALLAAAAPPAAIDWRNNNGDWTTAIRDQSSCGSCVSFATCATLEARIKIACKDAAMAPDLAEAHVFYCGCGNCCGSGWNFPPALDFCKTTGVAVESAFPYTPGDQPCKPGLAPYVKITEWSAIYSIEDRKSVIAAKGPVVAGMAVYDDFYSYRTGVYRHATGALVGYHAVSVVGYDDAQQCWIAKNSWGPGWGDNGWFRIGYGEAEMETSFAFYDADVPCPKPEPVDKCSQYLPILARTRQLARTNPRLRACLAYYVCGQGSRPSCTPRQMRLVRAIAAILRRCPQYRKAFCRGLR
jgi:hypothetical protein